MNAALERWEEYGEREIISQIELIADPRKRLPELFRRVAHELQPHRVYAALLKALDHPQVVPVMARVSQRRMEFLHTAYREAGLPAPEALNRARLTYAAYVGFLQLNFTLGSATDQPRRVRRVRRAHDHHAYSCLSDGDAGS